jgi:hypothetical protein
MKVLALYKTFDGEEFIEASVASIYEHVDTIVMVHSDVSWTGQTGNTARPAAIGWCDRYDYAGKVHHVSISTPTQEEQYRAGIEYIDEHELPYDVVMVVDCDEVWDDANLSAALDKVRNDDRKSAAYSARMKTYIKTIFYRIEPDKGIPTVFLRNPRLLLQSARAWKGPDIMPLGSLYFHHFSCVRTSREKIRQKIEASCVGDDSETLVDLDEWFREKWDKLPAATDLHPFAGRADFWKRVCPVWIDDLPPAVVENEAIMRWYLPPGEMPEDETILRELAMGKQLVIDLGTFLGRSAVVMSLGAERVVTVDLFEEIVDSDMFRDSGETYAPRFNRLQYSCDKISKWLSQYANIEVVQGDTADASERFEPASVDLVFIDADHAGLGVSRDFFAWLPKIKRDGIVVFHDVNHLHVEVETFVERVVAGMPNMIPLHISEDPGSLRAFVKVSP